MPEVIDIFRSNAFGVTELTDYVNRQPYESTFLGDLGLFSGEGVATTTVYLERNTGFIRLVPTRPRNAPGAPYRRDTREAIPLPIPHIYQEDMVYSSEVQDLKALGMNVGLEDVQTVSNRHLDGMRRNDDVTQEFHRVGAFLGIILDADGTTYLNLFTEFGVTQATPVAFTFGTDLVPAVITDINSIRRTMEGRLQMGGVQVGQMIALCGDAFYDGLLSHAAVRDSYKDWQNSMVNNMGSFAQPNDFLRMNWVYNSFLWQGVLWHNYRGTNPNTGSPMIPTNEAHFAPNMPGLFQARWGPRNKISGVNEVGIPRYAASYVDPEDRYVKLDYESDVIYYCTRPEVLMVATAS